jgi:hypothetical protein
MSTSALKIEEAFKKLDPREQAELYGRLGDLVYGGDEESDAFIATLKRRVSEIESGKVKGRDAFEVVDEMRARHAR